jgi:hypothetical protein
MAGKNRKTPFASIVPSQEKTPRTAAELPLYTDQKAAWRVSKIQLIEPYGWHELSPFEVAKIKDRLSSFEKNTWKEIFVDQARFHHRYLGRRVEVFDGSPMDEKEHARPGLSLDSARYGSRTDMGHSLARGVPSSVLGS